MDDMNLENQDENFLTQSQNSEQKIELAQEEISVSKKIESEALRFYKKVLTDDVELPIEMTQEQVTINKVAVNKEIDAPVDMRQEGDTLIVPVIKEVAVVVKKLMLVEEIHITKTAKQVLEVVKDSIRKEIFEEDNNNN